MRIGFFTDGYLPQPNGVATSVYETAKELERRGHEVYIVAPKYPGYKDNKKNVIRLASVNVHKPTKTRIALNLPDQNLRRAMLIDFDIIHGHSGGPVTLLGWEVARSKKIPYVVTYHTLWNRYTHYFLKGKVVTPKMMERATKIFGNRVDFLIAPTAPVEKELRSYGVKKPIKVVPSGIDTDLFLNAKEGVLRKRLGLKNEPIALFVGRLGKEKSVDFIIKSFVKTLEKVKDARLVIVGDGDEKKNLQKLTSRLKISQNVIFLGNIDNGKIQEIYKDADVFVFASTTETQGMIIPEALASGVPVVATKDPAFDCVESGKNGYLTERDMGDFADKVTTILKDKKLHSELSENATASAERFSIKKTADGLEGVYFELLEKASRESVAQIMGANARSENFFVLDVFFWFTVLVSRFFVLLFPPASAYPGVVLGGQSYSLGSFGLLVLLFGFAAFLIRRKASLLNLALVGIGGGLVVSEAYSLLTSHQTLLNYWNPLNIIPIIIFGVLPIIFIRTNIKDRPKFYINTIAQKHENPEHPLISVVVPAFNEGEFIEPTLKSLINQSYKNFELIVVDNNSTDNTGEVAKKYGARVIVEKEKGVAAARNAGFVAARGSVVASIDADSIAPENWLSQIAASYEKNDKLVAFGGLNYLYSGPVTARAADRFLFGPFWKLDKALNHGWNLAGFNMSVKKSAFEKIGGFKTGLKMGEDIDLSARLREIGLVGVDSNLVVYSSGRRFRNGLLSGVSIYVPYWFSKVILHRDQFFEFKDVRSEKGQVSAVSSFVPICVVLALLFTLFYIAIQKS